jgi:anti-sigma-K factor RskA
VNYLHPPRLDALARDYAVGTLRGPARRRFERVLRDEAVAARALAAWQARLATLAASVPVVPPREAAWQAIEARLFGPAPGAAAPAGWRGWRGGWAGRRGAGLGLHWAGALALGALLALGLLRWQPQWAGLEPASTNLPAAYVGILSDAGGQPLVLASSRRQGRLLSLKWVRAASVPAGAVPRLWALPADGGAARWVGDLAPGPAKAPGRAQITLPAPSEEIFAAVDRLALSLETGPPGLAPAAPFVAQGPCVKLW